MSENQDSGTEVIPVSSEYQSPLLPEKYKSYSVQRKIVGYHATGGDTIVFKRNDFEATEKQTRDFEEDIVSGEFNADELSKMLRFLPNGLNGEDKLMNYAGLGVRLTDDEFMNQIMAGLAGVSNPNDLDQGHIANYLRANPTPVEMGDKLDKFLKRIEEETDDVGVRRSYEEAAKDLLECIYGDRFKYYQNFKLMMEKAQGRESKKKPLTLSKPSRVRKTAGVLPAWALSTTFALSSLGGAAYIARDFMQDGKVDGPFTPHEVQASRAETEQENAVEEKNDIKILDVREAFKKLGKDFNIYDESVLGRNPPSWWSEDQIKLLDEELTKLPEYFYAPLGDEKLSFALTDYGEDCPCAGTFNENYPNYKPAFVFLSDGSFKPNENSDWPFRLLTHELAHRVDIDINERKLGEKVIRILGFDDFTKAREHFMPILKREFEDGNIDGSVNYNLNYGFMGINDNGLTRPTELFAKLVEIYVGGRDEFMAMSGLFGEGKTEELYEFVKNEIFEGREYSTNQEQNQLEEDDQYGRSAEEIQELQYSIEELKEKYGVDFSYVPEKHVTREDIDTLSGILDIFPDYFLQNLGEVGKFSIVLDDNVDLDERHDGQVVNVSIESLEKKLDPYEYQLHAVKQIGHELAHRANELSGFELQDKLIELLGGEKFLKNPEKLFPKLFEKNKKGKFKKNSYTTKSGSLRSADELLAIFSSYYLNGENTFPRDTYYFGSKSSEIYTFIKEMYRGREYEGGGYGFIPRFRDTSSN